MQLCDISARNPLVYTYSLWNHLLFGPSVANPISMPPNSSGPDYREAILNNELNNERILIETFEESVDRHTGGQIDRQTIDDHWLTYERAGLR